MSLYVPFYDTWTLITSSFRAVAGALKVGLGDASPTSRNGWILTSQNSPFRMHFVQKCFACYSGKPHNWGLRDLAAIGRQIRSHTAGSGMKIRW